MFVLTERQMGLWMRHVHMAPVASVVIAAQRKRHDAAGDHVAMQLVVEVGS